jgi:hypothetical protein
MSKIKTHKITIKDNGTANGMHYQTKNFRRPKMTKNKSING